jgi:hypothetical protein
MTEMLISFPLNPLATCSKLVSPSAYYLIPFKGIDNSQLLSLSWQFFNTTVVAALPAALGPGVYSASNRNEYQKHKNKVSGE